MFKFVVVLFVKLHLWSLGRFIRIKKGFGEWSGDRTVRRNSEAFLLRLTGVLPMAPSYGSWADLSEDLAETVRKVETFFGHREAPCRTVGDVKNT